MALYKLYPAKGSFRAYDTMQSIVVQAKDSTEARNIAALHHGEEGADGWLTSRVTSCKELSLPGPSGVIFLAFKVG